MNEVFTCVLALDDRRHGVLVHAFCVMSTHPHLVATDPKATLPRLQGLRDALVARAMNALHGRRESLWAPSSASAVVLASRADILDEAAESTAALEAAPSAREASGSAQRPALLGEYLLAARGSRRALRRHDVAVLRRAGGGRDLVGGGPLAA